MKKDLMKYENECRNMQENIKTNLNKLEKIALITDSYELIEEYLTNMIINERKEKKEGFQFRIGAYSEFQNNNEIIKQIYNHENILIVFEQIKNDNINNEDFDD